MKNMDSVYKSAKREQAEIKVKTWQLNILIKILVQFNNLFNLQLLGT